MKTIIKEKGKIRISEFDKSFYTDDHDVPALYIGTQIIAIGNGIGLWGDKNESHLRWKLDSDKEYEITIKEL